jgi:hypothetical protein
MVKMEISGCLSGFEHNNRAEQLGGIGAASQPCALDWRMVYLLANSRLASVVVFFSIQRSWSTDWYWPTTSGRSQIIKLAAFAL